MSKPNPLQWCQTCCGQHAVTTRCPGELPATSPEVHGWRVNACTPNGIDAFGVLICESDELWRARILTYPNVLWLIPGGRQTIKFWGKTAKEAEFKAVEFIREHCRARGFRMRDEMEPAQPARIDPTAIFPAQARSRDAPAPRKIRFLPCRFGVARASEAGGTGNLSETGMFIITSTPVDRGSELAVSLNIDEDVLQLRGSVVWMRKDHHAGRSPGMGVQLEVPPPAYVDYVRGLS